jgi:hypothetical protein
VPIDHHLPYHPAPRGLRYVAAGDARHDGGLMLSQLRFGSAHQSTDIEALRRVAWQLWDGNPGWRGTPRILLPISVAVVAHRSTHRLLRGSAAVVGRLCHGLRRQACAVGYRNERQREKLGHHEYSRSFPAVAYTCPRGQCVRQIVTLDRRSEIDHEYIYMIAKHAKCYGTTDFCNRRAG